MWFGGLWGEDDAEHAGVIITELASAAGVKSGRGTRKAQKRELHGFDRALAI